METDHKEICWRLMYQYVGINTTDGRSYDGFITHVDNEYVTLAVPTGEMIQEMRGLPAQESTYRQFGFYPGFFPRRRFLQRRILFPIASVFLLPFFI